MILWMNQLLEPGTYELVEPEPPKSPPDPACAAQDLEPTLRLVSPLPPAAARERSSRSSLLLVALTAFGLSGFAAGGMAGSVVALCLFLLW